MCQINKYIWLILCAWRLCELPLKASNWRIAAVLRGAGDLSKFFEEWNISTKLSSIAMTTVAGMADWVSSPHELISWGSSDLVYLRVNLLSERLVTKVIADLFFSKKAVISFSWLVNFNRNSDDNVYMYDSEDDLRRLRLIKLKFYYVNESSQRTIFWRMRYLVVYQYMICRYICIHDAFDSKKCVHAHEKENIFLVSSIGVLQTSDRLHRHLDRCGNWNENYIFQNISRKSDGLAFVQMKLTDFRRRRHHRQNWHAHCCVSPSCYRISSSFRVAQPEPAVVPPPRFWWVPRHCSNPIEWRKISMCLFDRHVLFDRLAIVFQGSIRPDDISMNQQMNTLLLSLTWTYSSMLRGKS